MINELKKIVNNSPERLVFLNIELVKKYNKLNSENAFGYAWMDMYNKSKYKERSEYSGIDEYYDKMWMQYPFSSKVFILSAATIREGKLDIKHFVNNDSGQFLEEFAEYVDSLKKADLKFIGYDLLPLKMSQLESHFAEYLIPAPSVVCVSGKVLWKISQMDDLKNVFKSAYGKFEPLYRTLIKFNIDFPYALVEEDTLAKLYDDEGAAAYLKGTEISGQKLQLIYKLVLKLAQVRGEKDSKEVVKEEKSGIITEIATYGYNRNEHLPKLKPYAAKLKPKNRANLVDIITAATIASGQNRKAADIRRAAEQISIDLNN